MILVTTDFISGKEIETIALVKGSTVQCKNVGKDIMSGFKNLVGGEMHSYTEMMDEARAIATRRMVEEAEHLGADAIICIRYKLLRHYAGGQRDHGLWDSGEV